MLCVSVVGIVLIKTSFVAVILLNRLECSDHTTIQSCFDNLNNFKPRNQHTLCLQGLSYLTEDL